jgi:predicted ATPase
VLTKLRIHNFKAWSDTKSIRLAPLTVFFGSNSAGKTSLLQFLLMLRQTAESPDRRRVLHPGDRNTPVELGTYRDLVFDHDLEQKIRFAVEWLLPEPLVIRNPITRTSVSGKKIQFRAEIASDSKGGQQSITTFRYDLETDGDAIQVKMKAIESGPAGKYELSADNYELKRKTGRVWKLPEPIRFYGFPDEVGAYYQNAVFTSDLALSLEKQLKRIQYLGPLRTYPERSYVWSGEVPEHVGWRGERAVEAMLAAASRKISAGYKQRARPFLAVIAQWLQDLGLLDGFEVKTIAAHRKEYEVLVRTRKSKQTVNLTDVGFGVSQVLPVVVQCFYATPDTTILLEQPEIHLHPSVQTALADLFIEAVHSREDGADRSIQLIIESHSEHFLRRLQRRIAEGAIQPDQVALYFCESGENGAELRPLEVNLFGEIENWPDGFFGDEMGELAARMDAAAKREAVKE